MKRVILASASPARKSLLSRLGVPFETIPAALDERPRDGESSQALAARLALEKARAVARRHPHAVVIGSDQTASLDGEILGKPGNFDAAFRQLRNASGRALRFFTGLCLIDGDAAVDDFQLETIPFRVVFRPLSDAAISAYLRRDRPFDCAGSFRSERLGVALFERMEGEDATALMGLPLIALTTMLMRVGIDPLIR